MFTESWLTFGRITRVVGGETAAVQTIVRRIAEGDLSARAPVRSGDETRIVALMQHLQDRLTGIVGGIRSGIDSVATASAQIASGSLDLSSRTEEQSSSLQQTAAAVRGGEVTSQVVVAMGHISGASHKMADIIDGIAFQTNILALNAAVEAGGRLVHEAGGSMGQIVAQIKEANTLIGDITAAANEQGSGLAQSNQAVSQLDEVTQQHAALVEKSAAAGESLKEQARRLGEMIAVSKLAGGAEPVRTASLGV